MVDIYYLEDSLRCRLLPTNFRGDERKWHNDLRPDSIQSYDEYCHLLLNAFVGSAPCELHSVGQWPGEPLNDYLVKFNAVACHVTKKDKASEVVAFMSGVKLGEFSKKFRKYPRSKEELLS